MPISGHIFGIFPAFVQKLRRNPGDMWASVPPSPGSLFCVTFCHNVTSDLPFRSGTTGLFLLHTLARFEGPAAGAVPWALPAPQASFFCAHFRAFCAIRQQENSFLVRIFSDYPQSGKSFFVLLFSAFPHPGSVLFFVRLFATFPDNRSAPVSVIATSGKMPRRGSCCR